MIDHDTQHPLRPLLKNWVWEHGQVGTRYLDCTDGQIKFDAGKKARFASEKIFHVSLEEETDAKADAKTDAKTDADTPAIHEGFVARFLHAAQLGRPEDAGSVAEVQRATQDCILLGLVCAYQQEAQGALQRYALEPMFDDEIRAAVIVDIRRAYAPLRTQLALYDFTVFHGLPSPLLINESPFIDWRLRAKPAQPFVSLPLGPYCILVGTPSGKKSRAGPVLWKSAAAMGPLKDHNRHMVDGAQRWLVSTTDEQLAAVQARFAPPVPPEADLVSSAAKP